MANHWPQTLAAGCCPCPKTQKTRLALAEKRVLRQLAAKRRGGFAGGMETESKLVSAQLAPLTRIL